MSEDRGVTSKKLRSDQEGRRSELNGTDSRSVSIQSSRIGQPDKRAASGASYLESRLPTPIARRRGCRWHQIEEFGGKREK